MNWIDEHEGYPAAEYLDGMEMAYPQLWQRFKEGAKTQSAALIKRNPTFNNVAVITSGGGANGPYVPGYVADGLADAAVAGAPYAAPNAYCIYEVGKYLGREKGVLLLYNNFAGDFLNNDMAQELLELEGIQVESIASIDDIASALGEPRENRSGRCGIALLLKIAGSCAAKGMPLADVANMVRRARSRLGTISLKADFEKGEIEYGGGFSGEPGFKTATHMSIQKVAEEAMGFLLEDLKPQKGEKLMLLVNRLRLTSYTDSYKMAKCACEALAAQHSVMGVRVGAFSNLMDVYGFNFSIVCADDELARHLETPVRTDCFIL